jgi:hypothetical protein
VVTSKISKVLYDNFDTPEKIQSILGHITDEINVIKTAIGDIFARKNVTVTTSDGTFTFLNIKHEHSKSMNRAEDREFDITFNGVLKIEVTQMLLHSYMHLFRVLYPPHEGLVDLVHDSKALYSITPRQYAKRIINDTIILDNTTPFVVCESTAEVVRTSLRHNIPFEVASALSDPSKVEG